MLRVLPLALVALALGCDTATEPEEVRVVGVITGFKPDDPQIVTPDTVNAGEEFTVSVSTYGNGCVEKGSTEYEVDGLDATITPYDIEIRGGTIACTDVLKELTHTATLQFAGAGIARVTVQGRQRPRGDPVTVERSVVVE